MKNKKALGQHWLKQREILDEIAGYGAAVAGSATVALEIGPGLGTLTAALLRAFPRVMAVEFDPALAANLPKQFVGAALEVVQGDFLQFDLGQLTDYVVVANIPYYITAKIIQKLVEAERPPRRAVLLVQKEVAERIVAGADTGGAARVRTSLLSLMVAERATASLGIVVGREEFTPPPQVDSQVLILDFDREAMDEATRQRFWRVARAGFSNPRKKLVKNLGAVAERQAIAQAFEALGLDENVRAENLDFATWRKLSDML